ncbi:hypothetical protein [Clostridium tyrobutyricum]|uniref:hypothetical protein n=1 Tax=Clostridium tyrobutyricum TaxID=1519 RepID=UPI000AECBE0A|nr:hypothetical protein [Clostridium tyrobutyricum]
MEDCKNKDMLISKINDTVEILEEMKNNFEKRTTGYFTLTTAINLLEDYKNQI